MPEPGAPPPSPAASPAGRAAVFLDRDGTLIEERDYPTRKEDIVLLPGVGEALHRLASLGFLRIVLTNQSAVARGMLSEEELAGLHEHMLRQLHVAGGDLDDIYYCPHHPEGSAAGYAFPCACRKPARGLLDLALTEHPVDLSRSIFIGDSPRDLFAQAGPVAGRLLVRTGKPIVDDSDADAVVPGLVEATEWILERFGRRAVTIPGEPTPASGDVPHEGRPDETSGPHGQA